EDAVGYVPNAAVAGLFVVQVRTDPSKTGSNGVSTLLVPRNTAGLVVKDPPKATGDAIRWQHGAGAAVEFKRCRVPGEHVLGKVHQSSFGRDAFSARASVQLAPINLGVGRAAFDAAVEYAK